MTTSSIVATSVTKTFSKGPGLFRRRGVERKVHAVQDLTFQLSRGEFVGFLGPNGAGKSTTIKMLTGILHPTSGEITVSGLSPQRHRVELALKIGVVFGQRTQLWWDLPLIESFRILRAMYHVPVVEHQNRLAKLDDWLSLGAFLQTPVRQLSLGQRMRGELTAALLHQPEILFLDEPTIGLDVTAKSAIRSFLRDYNRETGATIILTTHDMGDVEELCERILMIHGGRVGFDGSTRELHRLVGIPSAMEVTFGDTSPLQVLQETALESHGLQIRRTDKPNSVQVDFNRAVLSPVEVLQRASCLGDVVDFSLKEPRLEDVIEQVYSETKR